MLPLNDYIKQNWIKTIRDNTCNGNSQLAMPKPFTSPSIEDKFQNFYYWDTYFINLGLLSDGFFEQAKNNIEDIAFFIRKLGYMPNASHLFFSSQPPLFTRAVYDYYLKTKDVLILKENIDAIITEYEFFMKERLTQIGLNQYGCCDFTKQQFEDIYSHYSKRLDIKKDTEEEKLHFVKNMLSIGESGWDCTPCFDTKTEPFALDKFVQIALNALLYDVENTIATIYKILGDFKEKKRFLSVAKTRKNLVNKYLFDKTTGFYRDYNFTDNTFSTTISTASFYPYALGLKRRKKDLISLLKLLELPYGVSTCEYKEKNTYLQWDYPLMWAPQVYFTYEALKNNGLRKDAYRLATKYVDTVEQNYLKTGVLWEKYNAKTGEIGCAKESKANPMLGWTAGVYQYLSKELNN
jgi:alpha,alpha-trehalase